MPDTLTGPSHPIEATLRRVSALNLYADSRLGTDGSEGWIPVATLIDASSGVLDTLLERAAATYETNDKQVIASLAMNGYSWPVVICLLGCFVTERRVPDIRPDNFIVRFSPEGYPQAVALQNPCFTALAGDPDADHPDAGTVASIDQLRDVCRVALEDHMAPLIRCLRAKLAWGEKAFWMTVADRCTSALLLLQKEALLPQGELTGEIDKLVHVTGSRLFSPKARVTWTMQDSEQCASLERGSCCLAYRLHDGEYCENCPLKKETNSGERVHAAKA